MKTRFPHRIVTESLFCRNCRNIGSHGVFAKELFSPRSGVKKGVPLLCICDDCNTFFVAFSHEFTSIKTPSASHFYTKILGHNRLVPGDWLYIKGEARPLKVKGIFHSAKEEIIVVKDADGTEKKIEQLYQEIKNEVSPRGYRLLPIQSADALIGDDIYHVLRNQFGKVVGFINDNYKDKLALLLDDDTLLFMSLPETAQYLENEKLKNQILEKLKEKFAQEIQSLKIDAGHGIIYIQGNVASYLQKREIIRFISMQKSVRGTVDFLNVIPPHQISDRQIEGFVLQILEDLSIPIYNYFYSVQNGSVQIKAFSYFDPSQLNIEERFMLIPGICELSLFIEESGSSSLRGQGLSVGRVLKDHLRLQDCNIRVSVLEDSILLEGRVNSILQKKQAAFIAIRMFKKIRLKNRLRVAI